MKVDLDDLRRHYAALSDDELFEIDRKDLVDAARQCYDEEAAKRGPASAAEGASAENEDAFENPTGEDPEWLDEAISAYAVLDRPGMHNAPKAAQAAHALQNAGVPVHLSQRTEKEGDGPPQIEYHVLVPGEWSLHAASVLDKEIFNPEIEATWKAYFRGLEDEELQAADTELLFAGFKDRLKRVTKAYKKELARRGLEAAPLPSSDSPGPLDE